MQKKGGCTRNVHVRQHGRFKLGFHRVFSFATSLGQSHGVLAAQVASVQYQVIDFVHGWSDIPYADRANVSQLQMLHLKGNTKQWYCHITHSCIIITQNWLSHHTQYYYHNIKVTITSHTVLLSPHKSDCHITDGSIIITQNWLSHHTQ